MRDAALHLVNVPADVREAVLTDARERDVSVNDAVGEILANHYGLGWETSGYRFTESNSDQWFLRMPSVLKHTIAAHADSIRGKQTGVVLHILAAHYGLDSPTTGVRRPEAEPRFTREQLIEWRSRVQDGESIRAIEREHGLPRMTLNRALRRLEAQRG